MRSIVAIVICYKVPTALPQVLTLKKEYNIKTTRVEETRPNALRLLRPPKPMKSATTNEYYDACLLFAF